MKHLPLVLFFPLCLQAQNELSLRVHESVPQASFINPALQVEKGVWASLPSGAFNFGNSGFTYNDLVAVEGDSAVLDMEGMIRALEPENVLFAELHVHFLAAYYRWKRWQVGFSHAEKLSINLKYPKELVEFLWYGNARFIGRTVDIAPDAEFIRYFETALSASRSLDRMSFGLRLKYLEGVSLVSSRGNRLSIHTEPETYNITVRSDLEVHFSDTGNLSRIELLPPSWFSNPGIAVDLGWHWQPTGNLHFAASMVDLGWIRWRNDVTTLRSSGELHFSGVDLSGFVQGDTLNAREYQDSLRKFLSIRESHGTFRSFLVAKFYLSADYHWNERWRSGLLIFSQYLGGLHPAVSVSIARSWLDSTSSHRLNTSLHYAYRNRSPYNLGAGVDWRWKHVQLFVLSDNIVSWVFPKARVPLRYFDSKNEGSIVIPRNLRNFNVRFGVNLWWSGGGSS